MVCLSQASAGFMSFMALLTQPCVYAMLSLIPLQVCKDILHLPPLTLPKNLPNMHPPITQQLSVFLFVLDSPIYLALPVCSQVWNHSLEHETSDHIHGKKCYPSKYLLPKLIRGGVWKSPFMLEFGCLDLT